MDKPDLSLFPAEPGVYLFKDPSGRILYVGKARRLRNRLASYFRDEAQLTAKTRIMVHNAASIDILRTGTEKEALLLEASLIKKHRPRYNILLRDDKEYLLFRIGASHPFPKVELLRKNQHKGKDKGERWFGPFSSGGAARETWRLIHKHFPLRRCRDASFANRTRPCLYYDMGQCTAPCVLPVPQEEYRALLDKVALILSGKSRYLIDELRGEMLAASENLRFEEAAKLRDQLKAVERTLERQSVVLPKSKTLDLVGVAQMPEGLALGVVFVREGLLLDGRTFFWPGLSVEDTPELLSGFLAQFYLDRRGLGESIPPRVVVPWLADDADEPDALNAPALPDIPAVPAASGAVDATAAHDDSDAHDNPDTPAVSGSKETSEAQTGNPYAVLEAALSDIRGEAVTISAPKGPDEDSLVLMAASNAREAVSGATREPLADMLARRLRSARPVRRIEVVDISHTGGQNTRAGMVVFEDEQPVKEAYRTYALDDALSEAGAEAGDDYAALAAFATRRAKREDWPDLLLVDGGKGQLEAVRQAFYKAGVQTGLGADDAFVLASIAKARDEEGHADRRAGNVSDRIFIPGRSNPVNFPPGSQELLFLQRIRDAAHDYVIGRHRQARKAATLSGELTRIPGVGPNLAKALFQRFGSLAAMAEAGEDALATVPGIGKQRARSIAQRLTMLVKR